MKTRATWSLFLALTVTALAPAASAQGRRAQPVDQEMTFTDVLVPSQLLTPAGQRTVVLRPAPGVSLVRYREHFVREMVKTVEGL